MNPKLLATLIDLARAHPDSIEAILKVAYANGKFDATSQAVGALSKRYVQPEAPEAA
jgi:hypothetical protein